MGTGKREGLLVLGSKKPHKATAETLRLLASWNARQQQPLPVRVTGLTAWPAEWPPPPEGRHIHWLGRVSDEQLADEYANTRALVLLSVIEGFGLPALEAILSGATVCYRNVSSVGEIMDGAPGGWDGRTAQGFDASLDAALAMPEETRRALAERLRASCRWDTLAQQTLAEYSRLFFTPREPAPSNR